MPDCVRNGTTGSIYLFILTKGTKHRYADHDLGFWGNSQRDHNIISYISVVFRQGYRNVLVPIFTLFTPPPIALTCQSFFFRPERILHGNLGVQVSSLKLMGGLN